MVPLRRRLQRVGLLESRDAVRRLSRGPVELRELVEPYGATGPRQALGRDGRQRLPGPASLAEEALGSAEPKRDLRVVAEGESVLPRLRRRGVLALSGVEVAQRAVDVLLLGRRELPESDQRLLEPMDCDTWLLQTLVAARQVDEGTGRRRLACRYLQLVDRLLAAIQRQEGEAEVLPDLPVVSTGSDRRAKVSRGLRVVPSLERHDAKALQDLGALRRGLRQRLRVNDGRRHRHEVNDQGENPAGKAQPRWNASGRSPRRPGHGVARCSVSANACSKYLTASSSASSFMHVSPSAMWTATSFRLCSIDRSNASRASRYRPRA